jgi:hypothetical protein
MIVLPALLVLLQTAPATGGVRLMSYDETVRCAGLTQAASELEGGESVEGKALSDAALYWSLTAGQAAVTAGKAPADADRDQSVARLRAVRELGAGNDEAKAELDRCRRRTPDLG